MSSVVFTVVGVTGLVGAAVYWRRVSKWLSTASTATAEIVRLEGNLPGQGSVPDSTRDRTMAFPVVRFTDDEGTLQEHRAKMGAAYGGLKKKKTIEVVYNPMDPSDVRLGKGADRSFAISLAFLSLLSLGMGIHGLVKPGA